MKRIRKISVKLFLTYVVACLIPIFLTSYYFITNLAAFTKKNTRLLSATANEQYQKNLLYVAENVENIINTLISDPDLTAYLTMQYTSDYEAFIGYTEFLDKRVNSLIGEKYKILIYSDNNTIGISRMTNNSIEDFYRLSGKEADILSKSSVHFFSINSSLRNQPTICFYKTLTMSKGGIIIYTVEIPATVLIPYSSSEGMEAPKIYLFDEKGEVLASSRKGDLYSSLVTLSFDGILSLRELSNLEVLKLDGKKYYAFFNDISGKSINHRSFCPQWFLLYLVPYSNMQKNIDLMFSNSLLIVIGCIILSLILAIVMAKDITKRIIMLSGKTKDVLNGDFDIMAPVEFKDELGSLEADIYEMVTYLKNMVVGIFEANQSLIEEQSRNERLQQEKMKAELLALRRQINPHFLFNTLESIRMHLVLKNDMETANIIWLFSESYRTMFRLDQDNHKLRDELELINNYVEIQKYRLGNKFTYNVYMDTALGELVLPKLVLQPLVENALYHGVEGKRGKSDVKVTIFDVNDELVIIVADNGAGITEERLTDIRKALSDSTYLPGEFLALRNIQTRVRLISRGSCYLSIESQYGVGTTVRLTLPLVLEDNLNRDD